MAGKKYRTIKDEENLGRVSELVKELPQYIKNFFRDMTNQGLSTATELGYAYDLAHFFEYLWTLPGVTEADRTDRYPHLIERLSYDDIQNYISTVRTGSDLDGNKIIVTQRSDNYVARRVASLRSFFTYCIDAYDIQTNIVTKMKTVKKKKKPIIHLENNEVQRLLDAVTDYSELNHKTAELQKLVIKRDTAILYLLLGTGIRVSELVGIDMDDIDFMESRIRIIRKGGDTDFVYLPDSVELYLTDYINNERPAFTPPLKSDPDYSALFLSNRKKRLTVRSVETLVKKYSDRAGIAKNISPHKLRATFATGVYQQTGDIKLVADALHHSSVETTSRHYAETSKAQRRDVAKVAEGILKGN